MWWHVSNVPSVPGTLETCHHILFVPLTKRGDHNGNKSPAVPMETRRTRMLMAPRHVHEIAFNAGFPKA
jgi:hypothetical protein